MDNEVDRMKREIEQSMPAKMHDSPQFTDKRWTCSS